MSIEEQAALEKSTQTNENPYSKEAVERYIKKVQERPQVDSRFQFARSTEELRNRIIEIARAMVYSESLENRQSLFEIMTDLVPSAEDLEEGLR